jgi:hypothetical protein
VPVSHLIEPAHPLSEPVSLLTKSVYNLTGPPYTEPVSHLVEPVYLLSEPVSLLNKPVYNQTGLLRSPVSHLIKPVPCLLAGLLPWGGDEPILRGIHSSLFSLKT